MKWQTGFIGCLMLAAQTSAWAITYHVSPIAPGSAEAINEQGQITGWSDDAYVAQSDLSILKLGTFGGDDSSAYGINDQGQVVGHAQLPPGDQTVHAFRGFHNRPLNRATDDIGTLGGEWSVALDINNLGQVIGQSDVGDSVGRAFRTAPNAPINPATDDLGTLGGINSDAQAINDLGQVVGTSQYPDGSSHAYRTRPNLPINPATDDLGIPPVGDRTTEARPRIPKTKRWSVTIASAVRAANAHSTKQHETGRFGRRFWEASDVST